MIGYKGTDRDMRCRKFQYEVGETYELDGKPQLCYRGFHFCKSLKEVFDYYPSKGGNRFFEVEADDDSTIVGKDKCVTLRIKIIRELSPAEVNRCYYGNGYGSGYGIAVPCWRFILQRISERCKEHTMASLFDGISGFCLIWYELGGDIRFVSEIEEYPIAVCKRHFGDEETGEIGDIVKFVKR